VTNYDYVIIGAGSAGCAIAARLVEDAGARVLLLEAGGTDKTQWIRKPGMIALVHQIDELKKKFDWGYKTVPQKHLNNRKLQYTRGRVMGGSSAVNGMLYLRGNAANYDAWEAEGNAGWGHRDVLAMYKRLEAHQDGESEWHGGSGPIKIGKHDDVDPLSHRFMEAVADVCGVPIIDDFNGPSQEGASLFQMSAAGGLRYSTSIGYLSSLADKKNLVVESGALVERIVIEGGRARGVAYVVNGERRTANAEAEVILSAGAVGSPQILMLSGVGRPDHLKAHGIGVVADLPVGDNFHDHLFVPLNFHTPSARHTSNPFGFLATIAKEYMVGGTWFAKTFFEAGAFVKLSADAKIPDLQIHSMPWAYPQPNQDGPGRVVVDSKPSFSILPTLIYPKSRGTVRLASADPSAAPLIDPNYLADSSDMQHLVDGIRKVREIMASPKIAPFVASELHPGKKSASDDELRAEVRLRGTSVYHPVGSCRMGTDHRAVVGPDLRVRGVDGLRVADASIMPSIIGGNTNAPCIMIGEKCAELIRGK
jgi:choline dehydrogenase